MALEPLAFNLTFKYGVKLALKYGMPWAAQFASRNFRYPQAYLFGPSLISPVHSSDFSPAVMTPSNFGKALQRSHTFGSRTMEIMNSEINLKLLQNQYEDLREKHVNFDILVRDIRANLNLASGLIIFTRFNKAWSNWSDEESAVLIEGLMHERPARLNIVYKTGTQR